MALAGVKVIEFVGLAPGPFCGMVLADFGATVTRIDKTLNNPIDVLKGGKRSIAINLKNPKGQEIVRSMCKVSDVLIDPFRPGVLENLGLGPEIVLKDNPRLVYARLTGFGQYGPLARRAGHDINYIGLSGVLSFFGRANEKPTPPINYVADFAGGGMLCAFGICMALLERHKSGKGQIVDSSMTEGAAYVGSWLMRSQNLPIWGNKRGENIIDSGAHYYDTYETKDGKFMTVGCIEAQFYKIFLEKMNLPADISQYSDFKESKRIIQKQFLTKTQQEWSDIFDDTDACVFPVVEWEKVHKNKHNAERKSFVDKDLTDNVVVPNPAPVLSRTPGVSAALLKPTETISEIAEILKEVGIPQHDINKLHEDGVLVLDSKSNL